MKKKYPKLKHLKEPPIPKDRIPTRQEIISHSTMLTNARLDRIFLTVDVTKKRAWDDPRVEFIQSYFSSLYTLYDNIFPILTPDHNNLITKRFKEYAQKYLNLKQMHKGTIQNCFEILEILDKINRIIKGDLQQKSYFFKVGESNVKNIEESIKIVQEAGGFFGKRKV